MKGVDQLVLFYFFYSFASFFPSQLVGLDLELIATETL